MSIERLLSIQDVADRLGLSAQTLRDRSYRMRIGLRGIKVGRKIRFTELDLAKFIEARREGRSNE
jgi:hypothetical protein